MTFIPYEHLFSVETNMIPYSFTCICNNMGIELINEYIHYYYLKLV